jgi:single-stranded-DNA-specific exonuclease
VRGIRWLTKKINPVEFLSYSALCTLADVSPIIGDNRIIVKNGLKEYALSHVVASGLMALIKRSGIYTRNISQEDVLFRIAPRINAVGRMINPDLAYKLLIEHDQTLSDLIANKLNEHNKERKKIQKSIEREAVEAVRKNEELYKHGIVVYNPNWPVGIVGIVASKLAETFCKPAIVIGQNNDNFKGSGRSYGTINLKKILDGCSQALLSYGGHYSAAGVTVKPEYIDKINTLFNEQCEKYYEANGYPEIVRYYDATLKPQALSKVNADILIDSVYPYCQQNNPEPVFLLSNAEITDAEYQEKEEFSMLTFKGMKENVKSELPFRMFSGKYGAEVNGNIADIYFTFPQNTEEAKYNRPSLNVLDIILKTS